MPKTMTLNMTGLDLSQFTPNLSVDDGRRRQKYPALQSNDYLPKNAKDKVFLCVNVESSELLAEDACRILGEPVEATFNGNDTLVFPVAEGVRFILLRIPQIFVHDKDDNSISRLTKGVRFAGTNKQTIAKCLFAAIDSDNEMVRKDDGSVQIFTLKLNSSKTSLISSRDDSDATFKTVNELVQSQLSLKGSVIHLVSMAIAVESVKCTSKSNGQSTLGIKFVIDGNPEMLSPLLHAEMAQIANSDEVKQFTNDPFNIKGSQAEAGTQRQSPPLDQESEDVDYDDISF